jgi:pyridoxine 4-dehydrogenase
MVSPKLSLAGTEVPRIGLGTNRLTSTPAHVDLVKTAVAAGVGFIDTAHLYTGGESEATIGAALSPRPEDCVVGTKGGYHPGEGRPEVLRAQIEDSLRRLRTDSITLYYLHRVDPETPLEDSLGTIKEYRDSGRIRHVGVCEVGIDLIERARLVMPISVVQNHYNLSDREYDEVVDYCAAEGIVFFPSSRCTSAAAVRSPRSRNTTTPLRHKSPLRGSSSARRRCCRSQARSRSTT